MDNPPRLEQLAWPAFCFARELFDQICQLDDAAKFVLSHSERSPRPVSPVLLYPHARRIFDFISSEGSAFDSLIAAINEVEQEAWRAAGDNEILLGYSHSPTPPPLSWETSKLKQVIADAKTWLASIMLADGTYGQEARRWPHAVLCSGSLIQDFRDGLTDFTQSEAIAGQLWLEATLMTESRSQLFCIDVPDSIETVPSTSESVPDNIEEDASHQAVGQTTDTPPASELLEPEMAELSPEDQRLEMGRQLYNGPLSWREVTVRLTGEMSPPQPAIDRMKSAVRRFCQRTNRTLKKKSPGKKQALKTDS